MSVLHTLTQHLWCPWLLGGFLLTGLVYSFGSGFFPFFHARLWLGTTLGSLFHSSKAKNGGGLSSIQVGTHETNPTKPECTDCQSFRMK
mgnify:CR=1 FL=1